MLTATKVRNTITGEITGTRLDDPDQSAKGRDCLIVDDICDGGRTFIELAKVIRQQGPARGYLYVTHGIFSNGLGIFQGLTDGVYTTDSFLSRDVENPRQSPVSLHVHHLDFDRLCP